MFRPKTSSDLDVFWVKRSLGEQRPLKNKTPNVLNFAEFSGGDAREVIRVSFVASPEPQIVTIESDSNEPTIPYGNGRKQLIIPPILNDLKLPINHFNVKMPISPAPIKEERMHHPKIDGIPTQQEVFDISNISKSSMLGSSVSAWQTNSDVGTF